MTENTPPVCNYEDSDYQQSFWETGGRAYEDAAEEIALKHLLPAGGKNLLELGAGAGRNTSRYAGFESITLVDYSLTQLQQAVNRLGRSERYRYVAADIYRLPLGERLFDAATMIRTLHHMKDAPLALAKVQACLQPGAVFILEYANKLNLKAMLRYALKRQTWNPYSLEPVEFAELNFDFHPQAIRNWLQQTGFRLERQLTVSHFRVGFLKRLFPARFLAALDSVASLTGDWWQLTPSVFTRSIVENKADGLVDALFHCPACRTPLQDTPPELICSGCGKRYPVIDGIYDFRAG
ncbi:MAG: methyltransferase domain-containing protein [Leptolinea sp.]|jgi:ubiquinone/menaquinone biosynthesis C-methylase UbiE|nr:methyltransferase domain-containing protein [Leptolinea sp.]